MTILTNSNRVQLKTSAFIMVSSNLLIKSESNAALIWGTFDMQDDTVVEI